MVTTVWRALSVGALYSGCYDFHGGCVCLLARRGFALCLFVSLRGVYNLFVLFSPGHSLSDRDWKKIGDLAHKIKPSFTFMGISVAKDLIIDIELDEEARLTLVFRQESTELLRPALGVSHHLPRG